MSKKDRTTQSQDKTQDNRGGTPDQAMQQQGLDPGKQMRNPPSQGGEQKQQPSGGQKQPQPSGGEKQHSFADWEREHHLNDQGH